MDIEAELSLTQAFVLTESHITQIWKVLKDNGMTVTMTVKYSDDTTRTFDTHQAIGQNANTRRCRIVSVNIIGRRRPTSFGRSADIFFGDRFFKSISLSIDAEEHIAIPLRTEIGDIIAGTRAWYSPVAVRPLLVAVFCCLYVPLIFFATMAGNLDDQPSHSSFHVAVIEFIEITGALSMLLALFFGIYKLLKFLFPIKSFLIGQGVEQYRILENVRWGIVIALVVGLVSSIIGSLTLQL